METAVVRQVAALGRKVDTLQPQLDGFPMDGAEHLGALERHGRGSDAANRTVGQRLPAAGERRRQDDALPYPAPGCRSKHPRRGGTMRKR